MDCEKAIRRRAAHSRERHYRLRAAILYYCVTISFMSPRKPELHWIEKALGGRSEPAESKLEDKNHRPGRKTFDRPTKKNLGRKMRRVTGSA